MIWPWPMHGPGIGIIPFPKAAHFRVAAQSLGIILHFFIIIKKKLMLLVCKRMAEESPASCVEEKWSSYPRQGNPSRYQTMGLNSIIQQFLQKKGKLISIPVGKGKTHK